MTADAERILALCESLMQAETLETAVQWAARRVNEATQSVACGIVIVLHGGVFLEGWHPEEQQRRLDRFQTMKRLTMHSAQSGVSGSTPLDGPGSAPDVVHAVHFALSHRLSGGLCVVSAPGSRSDGPADGALLERLARMIALRIDGMLDIDAERRKSQQFERWFRVSDRQIRALDLERQKFAALGSSFAGGAFVAGRDGIISWQSRPLLEREGSGASNPWVGRTCQEFCSALGSAGGLACGECLVARVLECRQPAGNDVVFAEAGDERVMRVAASPINDLAGRAQEVVVTFQDALPLPRAAAA